MSEIINISLESDLSEFTSTVEDSGDLYWSADAALAGTSGGMACLIDDTNAIYGEYNLGTSATSGTYRFRLYFDPNDLSMGNGDNFILGYFLTSATTFGYLEFQYVTGTGYQVRLGQRDDASIWRYTSAYTISNAPHYIELEWVRATNSTSNDGESNLWVDGELKESKADIDNFDRLSNFDVARFGAVGNIDGTTSGTFYIDEIKANDDGSEIGPLAPSTLSASTSDGLTLGESMQSVASLGNIDVALDNANYQGTGVRII